MNYEEKQLKRHSLEKVKQLAINELRIKRSETFDKIYNLPEYKGNHQNPEVVRLLDEAEVLRKQILTLKYGDTVNKEVRPAFNE